MVGATLHDDSILSRAAKQSGVPGASVQQLVRLAILRLSMGLDEAKTTVFGNTDDIASTDGRAFGNIPQHELDLVRSVLEGIGETFASLTNSQLVRIGLAILAGENEIKALSEPAMKRGPKSANSRANSHE